MKTKADQCKEEGNKCMKDGKHMEAVIHYTEAIKYNPSCAALYSNRSLAFLKIDQLYLAMEDAKKTISIEPSWPKGFFRKGEIEHKAGHYTFALMSYKQALLLDPTDEGVNTAISRTNRDLSRDRKEEASKPMQYAAIGLVVGVLIILADQYLAPKPSVQYTVLQVLLITLCGALGFAFAKIQRYLVTSQRASMLEEPLDLLGEFGGKAQNGNTKNAPSSTSPSQKHSKPSARKRTAQS